MVVNSDGRYGYTSGTIREIVILQELDHDCIIRIQDVTCFRKRMALVLEIFKYNLMQFRQKHPEESKDPNTTKKFLYQILSGCHSHGVLHRDLKPHNLLINKDTLSSKIADFGSARTVTPVLEFTEEVGTFYYEALEVLLGSKEYIF